MTEFYFGKPFPIFMQKPMKFYTSCGILLRNSIWKKLVPTQTLNDHISRNNQLENGDDKGDIKNQVKTLHNWKSMNEHGSIYITIIFHIFKQINQFHFLEKRFPFGFGAEMKGFFGFFFFSLLDWLIGFRDLSTGAGGWNDNDGFQVWISIKSYSGSGGHGDVIVASRILIGRRQNMGSGTHDRNN